MQFATPSVEEEEVKSGIILAFSIGHQCDRDLASLSRVQTLFQNSLLFFQLFFYYIFNVIRVQFKNSSNFLKKESDS